MSRRNDDDGNRKIRSAFCGKVVNVRNQASEKWTRLERRWGRKRTRGAIFVAGTTVGLALYRWSNRTDGATGQMEQPDRWNRNLSDVWSRFNITDEKPEYSVWQINPDDLICALLIPKSGSSTVKNRTAGRLCWNLCDTKCTESAFRFTFLRDPIYRMVSGTFYNLSLFAQHDLRSIALYLTAYGTILNRNEGIVAGVRNSHGSRPETNASAVAWRRHLNDWLQFASYTLLQNNGSQGVNGHLHKQIDIIKKWNNLDFIGCAYDNKEFKNITESHYRQISVITNLSRLDPSSQGTRVLKNQKEHPSWMPTNWAEWRNVKYLTEKTKEMIRAYYADDIALWEFVCGTNENALPIF